MNSRRRFACATGVVVLAISACGGSSSDDALRDTEVDGTSVASDTVDELVDTVSDPPDTEPSPVDTEPEPVESAPETAPEPGPEPAPEPGPEPEAAPEPEPGSDAPAGDGSDGSCLVGAWVITEDQLNAYYDVLEASLATGGPGPTFDIVGDVLLTFGETVYSYTADFDLILDVVGQQGTGATTGTVSGEWDVVDGLVTTMLGSSDLDIVIDIAGTTVSGSDFGNGLLDSAPINNAPFDCAGPTIGFQADATGDVRHDVLLTPV